MNKREKKKKTQEIWTIPDAQNLSQISWSQPIYWVGKLHAVKDSLSDV